MSIPDGFVWGAAASSYQIEGAARADGKGPSIWDHFCTQPGAIRDADTGEIACDHYHRVADDVSLMRDLGLHAYRLSISWPRVIPDGAGSPNETGLGYYDELVDRLLEAGVEPWVTLYHWDLPLALQRQGGWLNREIVEWFDRYARLVVDRLSDRVAHWITINEPQIFLEFGHATGVHAPGLRLGLPDQLRAAHHVLLSHGKAVRTIRERSRTKPRIGWAPVGSAFIPETDSTADIEAARLASFASNESIYTNAWFADPVVLGNYPEDGLRAFGSQMPRLDARDLEIISAPIDFYGVNTYSGQRVRAAPGGGIEIGRRAAGFSRTSFGWPVEPDCLYWAPRFLAERYGLPIVVTENGMSQFDAPDLDGRVQDPARIDFLARYIGAMARAIDDGVDIRGYFHWSLFDNFEWAEGYSQRFGLVHVDYDSLERTPKLSAQWYAQVIRSNGSRLGLPEISRVREDGSDLAHGHAPASDAP